MMDRVAKALTVVAGGFWGLVGLLRIVNAVVSGKTRCWFRRCKSR